MRYEELFQESARVAEPPVPGDVVATVRRAQARRRRTQALVLAPLAVLAVVVAVALLPGGGKGTPIPGSTPTAAHTSAPPSFTAVKNGRLAIHVVTSGRATDQGPATAFSGPWVARPTGSCRSQLVNRAQSTSHPVDVAGGVGAMALSPDDKTLAYARSAPAQDPGLPEYTCGMDSLVLRDVATGTERVWSGDDGGLSSLSWSPDSTHLAFQAVACCDKSTEIKSLDVTRAPGPVSAIASVHTPVKGLIHDPVWSGDTLLLLQDDIDTTGGGADVYSVVDLSGNVVATLPRSGVSLDVDGRWLLVALYGEAETPGSLIALQAGSSEQPLTLGTGYSQARWS